MAEEGESLSTQDLGPNQPKEEKTNNPDTPNQTPSNKKEQAWQKLGEEAKTIGGRTDLTEEQKRDLHDEALDRYFAVTEYQPRTYDPNETLEDVLAEVRARTDLNDKEKEELEKYYRHGTERMKFIKERTRIMQNLRDEVSTVAPELLNEHEPEHLEEVIKEKKLFQEEAETVRARTYAELFIGVLQKLIEQQSVRQGLGDPPLQVQNVIDFHNFYRHLGSEDFTLVQTLGAMKRIFFTNYQTRGERPTLESLDLYSLVDQAAKQTGDAKSDETKK